jgi:hypothetical protein
VSDDGSPDWVRDALRQFLEEVRLFVRTAVDFTLHPSAFAEAWVVGRQRALNPIGFLATAFAVLAPFDALLVHLVHKTGDEAGQPSLLRAALGAILPFGYYLLLGMLQHATLRAFGSKRRLRDSCAMALYAGGGPASAARIVVELMVLALYYHSGRTSVGQGHMGTAGYLLLAGATFSFSLFLIPLSTAIGGLHHAYGIRWWHVLIANIVAIVVSAFLFDLIHPPGSYGLHLRLGFHDGDLSFGLTL